MIVYVVTEASSENGETYWVEGVYANEELAKAAIKQWKEDDCMSAPDPSDETPTQAHCFVENPGEDDDPEESFWCAWCSRGQGYEAHEVIDTNTRAMQIPAPQAE